ncbi:hypothetical protein NLI96_g10817 [Meripilus lineatus]|uniref:SET domain-containing protein n=1 Tax=Meripilus lineatus TaxID=2056292 RepID=A0AAD5UVB2_9APHY|nr:hypothetical protein NLI96_g10817 [Physisporinus lineatus]
MGNPESSGTPTKPQLSSGKPVTETEKTPLDDLVRSVFRRVWEEFYDWDTHSSLEAIASLSRKESRPSGDKYSGLPRDTSECACVSEQDSPELQASGSSSTFTLYDFEAEGQTPTSSTISIPTYDVTAIAPSSSYESCAPVSQHILHGDDPSSLSFIPFADDPTFDVETYTSEYTNFAWQEPACSPELREIVLETARRLRYDHGISVEEMDSTNILPYPLDINDLSSLPIYRQNDRIVWRGTTEFFVPQLIGRRVPRAHGVRGRLDSVISLFCPNLACIQAFCSPHGTSLVLSQSQLFQYSKRARDNKYHCMWRSVLCCIAPVKHFNTWSHTEIEDLETILSLTTDATPCDLAVLCRRPCNQVYFKLRGYTKDSAPPDMPPSDTITQSGASVSVRHEYVLMAASMLVLVPHRTVSVSKDCSTASEVAFVAKIASVGSVDVNVFFANPSQMKKRVPLVRLDLTVLAIRPVVNVTRRCVPDAVSDPDNGACQKAQHQHYRYKAVEVKQSDWGFGVFLAEPANCGDLICEYTGELIYEPTARTRTLLQKHLHRSYDFKLNSSFDIDAARAGNEARFINHAEGNKANCEALSSSLPSLANWCDLNSRPATLVNGSHIIGILAKKRLRKGAELFLDYGVDFDEEFL